MNKAIYKSVLLLLKSSTKYYNRGHVFPATSGMKGTDDLGKWFWKFYNVYQLFLFLHSVTSVFPFFTLLSVHNSPPNPTQTTANKCPEERGRCPQPGQLKRGEDSSARRGLCWESLPTSQGVQEKHSPELPRMGSPFRPPQPSTRPDLRTGSKEVTGSSGPQLPPGQGWPQGP